MNIQCPHCKTAYTIDHVELRDREICARCDKVFFVEFFKKPFEREGTSFMCKALYGTTIIALIILSVCIVNYTKQKMYQRELSFVNKRYLEEKNNLKKEFGKENKRKIETISRLKKTNAGLLEKNEGLHIKLETQQLALAALIEVAEAKEVGPIDETEKPVEFLDVNLQKEIREIKDTPETRRAAINAAEIWLKLVDKGLYSRSWIEAADHYKNSRPQSKWIRDFHAVRSPFGKFKTRKVKSSQYEGGFVTVSFQASFENRRSAIEKVGVSLQKDGTWRVTFYYLF
jgi:predicted Zn finger-like uncharacterized protein